MRVRACVRLCVCFSSAQRGAEAFQWGVAENESRERPPDSAAGVSVQTYVAEACTCTDGGRRWILVCGMFPEGREGHRGAWHRMIFLHQSKLSEQPHLHRPEQEMLTFRLPCLLSCNNRGVHLYTPTQRSSRGF